MALFNQEDWLGRAHAFEGRSQVLTGLGVCNSENQAWIRDLFSINSICFFLFAVPEPLIELLLCKASAFNKLLEILLVPRAVIEVVVADQGLDLVLCFATLWHVFLGAGSCHWARYIITFIWTNLTSTWLGWISVCDSVRGLCEHVVNVHEWWLLILLGNSDIEVVINWFLWARSCRIRAWEVTWFDLFEKWALFFLKLNSLVVEFEETSSTLSWLKALNCSLDNLHLLLDFVNMGFYCVLGDLRIVRALLNTFSVFFLIILHTWQAALPLAAAVARSERIIKFMLTRADRYCWRVSCQTLLRGDLFKGKRLTLLFCVLIVAGLWNWVEF